MPKNSNSPKKKRKYYRHCGFCDFRFEQSNGFRVKWSPNGWVCDKCKFEYEMEHLDEEIETW